MSNLFKANVMTIFATLALCFTNANAQDQTKTFKCDIDFLGTAFKYINEQCVLEKRDRELFTCTSETFEKTIPYLCSPMAKQHFRNNAFIFEGKAKVAENYQKKLISKVEYERKKRMFSELYESELRLFYKQYDSIMENYKNYSNARVAQLDEQLRILRSDNYRSSVYIDAIGIFNGPSLIQSNTPKIDNYFINGKSFSCTTINNLTSCL